MSKKMPTPPKKDDLPKMPVGPVVEGEGLELPEHLDDKTGADGLSKTADAMLNPETAHLEEDERFKKPQISSADGNSKTHKKVAPSPRKGIEVVAMRKGFYNQQRYEPGDQFFIRERSELGEWMKCVDAGEEKYRVDFFKKKKSRKPEDEE
jgi:hypothetical protein